MKIKNPKGLMLREISGPWVVVPVGEMVVEFNGLMALSESGALLWKKLEAGADFDQLLAAIISEYDVPEDAARSDIEEFLSQLADKGIIE